MTVTGTADRLEPGRDHRGRCRSGWTRSTCRGRPSPSAGVSADQEEAFADLGLAVLAAIAIVFLIMVATFRSLIQPLILLVSIPFAATGAIGLLLITGTPLGVPALIGVLMLVGIVVTNAIVLLDLINQYRAQGMGGHRGGGRGWPAPAAADPDDRDRDHLRAAADGARPHRQGGFISQPLAIVVIGGLLSSTLLTLVLVPTLYTMVEGATAALGVTAGGGGEPGPARAGGRGAGSGR